MTDIFSVQGKIDRLEQKFSSLPLLEDRYHLLIEMGRALPPYPAEWKMEKYLVKGCQSTLYLHAECKKGILYYAATSDALISAGLAALLLAVYNGETPEAILKTPLTFLQKFNLHASLSPMRSNGLDHLHRQMVREALHFLTNS